MTSGGRRLLVISYHFPPDGSVGGLRWAGIAKYLAPLGWDVCVLTAAPPSTGSAAHGVRVELCTPVRTINDYYRLFLRTDQRSRSRSLEPSGAIEPSGRSGLWGRLRMELAAFLALPDYSRGWTLRAAVRTRSLLRRFQPSVVVSSGPPHSAHLAARMATIGRPTRWFIDLRDPWAGPLTKAWIRQTRIENVLIPRLERLTFRAADGLIVNTPELAEGLATKYPNTRLMWVPNGVDRESLPAPCPDAFYPGLGIAYAGTLYGSRDLGPVLRALGRFLQRCPEAARAGSKLRVAGDAEGSQASALQHEIASLSLGPYVDVLGPLPRSRALELVSRSRLAVVLAQDQELQIPAKLYESVAMRIPTLVVAARQSAARNEGVRVGATVCEPNDIDGMVRLLEQLWRAGPQLAPEPGVPIAYKEIAVLVDKVLTGAAGPAAITAWEGT